MSKFQELYPGCHNFCRVYKLPISYPTEFCFGGGVSVEFLMIDWFNPWPEHLDNRFKDWSEVKVELIDFLQQKKYVEPNREYILITEFGESFIFSGRN